MSLLSFSLFDHQKQHQPVNDIVKQLNYPQHYKHCYTKVFESMSVPHSVIDSAFIHSESEAGTLGAHLFSYQLHAMLVHYQ